MNIRDTKVMNNQNNLKNNKIRNLDFLFQKYYKIGIIIKVV